MTNDEAIKLMIEKIKPCVSGQWREAVDMAIEALKAQDLVNEKPDLVNDLVNSRQAVLDAIDTVCDRECKYSKKQRDVMCDACVLGSAIEVIEDMPSAEPEIIRCKDCTHYSDRKCNSSKMWQSLYGNLSEVEFIERDPEDFCSYARRKK